MLEANFGMIKKIPKKYLKKKIVRKFVKLYNRIKNEIRDTKELFDLASNEKNLEIFKDISENLKVLKTAQTNEIRCFLSNEADALDTYIEIHAGAGGTESQDWAEMLRRMYIKWAEKKNLK